MDRPISIDVDLIVEIIGLPTYGEKPEKYMDDKTKEKSKENDIKNKYGTHRGSIGIIIRQINAPTTKFVIKMMACKLLIKCHKEESPIGVIETATQCEKGSLLS